MLKILIVDDNLELNQLLFNQIKNYNEDEFIITNISSNGEDAYNYLLTHSPDVVLLDLQMPKLNGIELISKLEAKRSLPKIIVITGDNSLLPEIIKLNIKLENIFTKPINFNSLIENLERIRKEKDNDEVELKIKELLKNFYFNKSSPGYRYIIESIKLCVKNNNLVTPFETNLYKKVAEKTNAKSNLHVKWSIDKSINVLNKYTNPDTLNKFFPYSKVTSKIFINEIFQRINNEILKK